MKPAPKIEPSVEPPIPEPLLRASEEAGRRKDAALDRLTGKLAEYLPPPPTGDSFGRAMAMLIDADKLASQARGK
jgi:hypothetical protein